MKGQDNPLIPNPHPYLLNSAIKKPIIVPSSYQPKKTHKPRKAIRTTKISQTSGPINLVADETVYKEWEDRMERAATTVSSLETERDSGNINRTLMLKASPLKSCLRGGYLCQYAVGDEAVHKELGDRMEKAATTASSLEAEQDGVHTLGSGEDSMKLMELMAHYTKLSALFWETASASTSENEEMEITATIDGRVKTITEASIRRHRKLEYSDGIPTLPNAEIFEQLALMGITSSPSLSPQTHPSTSQQPPTPPFMQTIHDAEEPATMPHDSSQPRVQSLGSDRATKLTYGAAYKLILRVKKLEHKGRIIAEIDQNPSISLVQDEGTSWIQEDAETQGRTSADTEILLEQEEPTKLVEDPGSGEKGEKEISTAEVLVSTASAIPEVSTAIPERQVYIRRSAEKRKDKGKAIMKDDDCSVRRKDALEQKDLGMKKLLDCKNDYRKMKTKDCHGCRNS
ncbi:hypothetical protein Tco_1076849 [Tanacetum coccineum]